MSGSIPTEALGLSVAIIIYSLFCLFLSVILICMLWSFGERSSYIALICTTLGVSTLASIIQQIFFAVNWRSLKNAEYQKALDNVGKPALVLVGVAGPEATSLYLIQFYCYNVDALLIAFWAGALFRAAWGFRVKCFRDYQDEVTLACKISAYVLPAITVGLSQIEAVTEITSLYFILGNGILVIGVCGGSVLLCLTLYKYVKTRRLATRPVERSKWWHSPSSSKNVSAPALNNDYGTETATSTHAPSAARRSIYDKALVTRFTIAFVLLAAFEIAIVSYQIIQYNSAMDLAASDGSDLSISRTMTDLIQYIPGVTASFISFLVFGTTKSWRQYMDLIMCRAAHRRRKARSHPPPSDFSDIPTFAPHQSVPSMDERDSWEEESPGLTMPMRVVRANSGDHLDFGEPSKSARTTIRPLPLPPLQTRLTTITSEQRHDMDMTTLPGMVVPRSSSRLDIVEPMVVRMEKTFEMSETKVNSPRGQSYPRLSAPGSARSMHIAMMMQQRTADSTSSRGGESSNEMNSPTFLWEDSSSQSSTTEREESDGLSRPTD